MTPFGLANGSQFRLPPPPSLDSDEYADAYNEVKLVGRFVSPFRPQDRTDVARFYAVTTPVMLFNSAARQVSAAQGKTLSENARIFALLGMAAQVAYWQHFQRRDEPPMSAAELARACASLFLDGAASISIPLPQEGGTHA